jgi:hypothetical protein
MFNAIELFKKGLLRQKLRVKIMASLLPFKPYENRLKLFTNK